MFKKIISFVLLNSLILSLCIIPKKVFADNLKSMNQVNSDNDYTNYLGMYD